MKIYLLIKLKLLDLRVKRLTKTYNKLLKEYQNKISL